MSDVSAGPIRIPSALAYSIVALAIAFELATLWLMLHPQVPSDYRAYYIDQTTTCLNQPVSGQYVLGQTVSFLPDGREAAKAVRVCGWDGPAGDGTHAVGLTSRLRFAVPDANPGPLALTLNLVAVEREGYPSQRVVVEANGATLGTATALAGIPLQLNLDVPADLLTSNAGLVDVALHFPDAIRISPGDSDTRSRSIKLLSARLASIDEFSRPQ